MARPRAPDPQCADPVGEVLHHLALQGVLYCNAELSEPWGIAVPPLDGCGCFQIVGSGRCWLEVDRHPPRWLEVGSLAFIPHGTPHRVASGPNQPMTPLAELPVEPLSPRYETLRHGGGGPTTRVTYGVVRFDHATAHRLLALLPPLIHLDTGEDDMSGWLQSTTRLIAREARSPRPGGETVITRLADVLIVQAIRHWLDTAPTPRSGWLAALRDERIGHALASFHRAPLDAWTLEGLAAAAGMSRSAFAARFTQLMGEPAVQYVTHWRMELARRHLGETDEGLAVVAERFGYGSEAAFCKAFKRIHGVSPGQVRRTARVTEPSEDEAV